MTSFARLLGAEAAKLATLPATWVALAVATAGHVLLALAGPVQAGGLLLAPAYAIAGVSVHAAGTEYRTGQIRLTLAAVPDRTRLLTAKAVVSLTVCLLAALPAGELVATYLLIALIGFGLAVITRGVVIPLAGLCLTPVVATVLPRPIAALLPVDDLPVLTVWAILCTTGAWALFCRRDS